MKKLLNHTIFLQMLCTILVIISVNSFLSNKAYETILAEVLKDNMQSSISMLETMNVELIKIYLNGEIDETVEINTNPLSDVGIIANEVNEIYNFNHDAMQWYELTHVSNTIREMKKEETLSASDLQYILDVHGVNQRLINAYNEILDSYGIKMYIRHDEEKYVKDIYKQFSAVAFAIVSEPSFDLLYQYEPITNDDSVVNVKSIITKNEAIEIANRYYTDITGLEANFEVEETVEKYTFKEDWNLNSNRDRYEITIDKESLGIDIRLTAWSGDGQFSEAIIDKYAKEYIDQLIPSGYVLYAKDIQMDGNQIDTVKYDFVYFDGEFYDERREITIAVDNQGELKRYNVLLIDPNNNKPILIEEEMIKEQITLGAIDSLFLVINHEGEFEYRVNLKLNDSNYMMIYDAITGQRKSVLNEIKLYDRRISL